MSKSIHAFKNQLYPEAPRAHFLHNHFITDRAWISMCCPNKLRKNVSLNVKKLNKLLNFLIICGDFLHMINT